MKKQEQVVRSSLQIGTTLRRLRLLKGKKQGDVSKATGLRQGTISALEKGSPGTQIETLMLVMAALDLEIVIRDRKKITEEDIRKISS